MALFQIWIANGSGWIGCEIFGSEKDAETFAAKNYKGESWIIEQIH